MRPKTLSGPIWATLVLLAWPAHAECFVDYKAKQDNPLQLAYGVSQVTDEICGDIGAQEADLAARLAAVRGSAEAAEGMMAFMQKRKPNWVV